MAADQPTPDAPKSTPRGAGFDDDEWVRRDLGPRPEVPNHGRRPVLMGIPILLITIAAVVAILVAGCGDEDKPGTTGGSGGSTPAAAAGDAATVEKALAQDGDQLAGRITNPDLMTGIECEPTDGTPPSYRCSMGADMGAGEPVYMVVRLQDDGTVTKLLAGDPPIAGEKTSEQTAELLAADDRYQEASKLAYVCATSAPVNPDGSSTGGTGAGQRCIGRKSGGSAIQRYVEFAADGTARRDYVLPADK